MNPFKTMTQSLHTHSLFDDGKAAPEEMVRAAAAAGLKAFGSSLHSPIPDEGWTCRPERVDEFKSEMRRLKNAYAEQLDVYCGVEYDLLSDRAYLQGFDYVIASVHGIPVNGAIWSMDDTRARSRRMIVLAFDGDADACAETYFRRVQTIAEIPEADVVGHFDLLTKFDEPEPLFDAGSPRYRHAALTAMEALVRAGKIFELNTGAVSRGYRTEFYPSNQLLRDLRDLGGKLTITSDSHAADTVVFGYAQAEQTARDAGFQELWQFDGRTFVPTEL